MSEDEALLELLRRLADAGYHFVTPTPATHARIVARLDRRRAKDLRDVFGWSLPFDRAILPEPVLSLLEAAGAVRETSQGLKSALRVSSLGEGLYLHSAFPTEAEDAVFFGPDSYRFAQLIEACAPRESPPGVILDMGAGSGVGGLTGARARPGRQVVLTDVNPRALTLARINAAFARIPVKTLETGSLDGLDEPVALALANPPYIADHQGREYRDGGALHGGSLSVEMARQAVVHLAPRGRLILYTGAAIVDGVDELKTALSEAMGQAGCRLSYRELDPDVFGEELDRPAYRDVERIAVVAAIVDKP